jgi:hypothetical protein
VTPDEYSRKTRRGIVAVTCLSGLLSPPLVVLAPKLPTIEDPGAGAIVLIVLALPVLAVIYFAADVLIAWLSSFLLTIPPFGRWTKWAEGLPTNRSGRSQMFLYFAGVVCLYWTLGVLVAIGLHTSGIARPRERSAVQPGVAAVEGQVQLALEFQLGSRRHGLCPWLLATPWYASPSEWGGLHR